MNSKQEFLKRMFLYRIQSVIAFFAAFAVFVWFVFRFPSAGEMGVVIYGGTLSFTVYNTIIYFGSRILIQKYGIEMFGDLDQKWLKDHQAFDSEAFGEIFLRMIRCRKMAGPYMFPIISGAFFLGPITAIIACIVCMSVYFVYRTTYLDDAVSYKVPRVFGGGGTIISKITDDDFIEKVSGKRKE
jgi:hypothetical protein